MGFFFLHKAVEPVPDEALGIYVVLLADGANAAATIWALDADGRSLMWLDFLLDRHGEPLVMGALACADDFSRRIRTAGGQVPIVARRSMALDILTLGNLAHRFDPIPDALAEACADELFEGAYGLLKRVKICRPAAERARCHPKGDALLAFEGGGDDLLRRCALLGLARMFEAEPMGGALPQVAR
jgi:hypothetical protein